MSFFNWGGGSPVPIPETIETFKELAGPLVAIGDFDGVNRLYIQAYGEAMKGRKNHPFEEMRARQAMELALQDVFTRSARERRRYFEAYGNDGWRKEKNKGG